MIKRLPIAVLALAPLLVSDYAGAEPASYTLTKQYGSVLFRVMQEELLYLTGRFDEFSGTLEFDPEDLSASSLSATVRMDSLAMADNSIVELLVSSSVWFNTSLYSEASFVTESVTVTGDSSVDFHGQLTFVGNSQPWTLSTTFHGGRDGELAGETIGITAIGNFNRSDFGVDQYMNVAADNVEIEVNVKYERD